MAKGDNNTKPNRTNNDSTTKHADKPKGRSSCCSVCIYTFLFVSGVFVATILPDLAGHHFKQPYGKQYGVMVQEVFKDLPKHLTNLAKTTVVVGRDLVDRLWVMKAEIDRRVEDVKNKKDDSSSTTKTKTTTQRSATKTTAATTIKQTTTTTTTSL
ncbi:unnamed protein product [Adineta steineri]|uniref:Uncharacterized protein n=1 Tax=Adineta steineri TaxID=433720 RepID=A0A818KBY3_9BILA|nr:unnamed protein product [Adineta steineri]